MRFSLHVQPEKFRLLCLTAKQVKQHDGESWTIFHRRDAGIGHAGAVIYLGFNWCGDISEKIKRKYES